MRSVVGGVLKLRRARAVAVLFCTLVGGVLLWRLAVGLWHSGRVSEASLYMLLGWDEKTTYAAGFTERKFAGVSPGLKETEVRRRLGEPLGVDFYPDSGIRYMRYSTGDMQGTFWMRGVAIDSSGAVCRITKMLWFD